MVEPNDPVIAARNADTGVLQIAIRDWAKRNNVKLKDECSIIQRWSGGVFMGYRVSTFNYTDAARK